MGRSARLILPLLAALALGTAGCGPDIQGLCEATEDCRGGNDADIDACVAATQYEVEAADIEGCTEEYELLFVCVLDQAKCNSNDTGFPCSDNGDCREAGFTSCSNGTCRNKTYGLEDADDCEAEANAYGRCQ